jgi:hypothetical protein
VTRRAGGGREREWKGRISLCIPATDPAERGFRPNLSNPSTYIGVRSTDPAGSDRKPSREPVARPVPVDRPDPVACPVPADRPDAVDVRLQLKAKERKKNEVALRERWVSDMKRKKEQEKKERWVLKRKKNRKRKEKKKRKQKKKNVTDGFF